MGFQADGLIFIKFDNSDTNGFSNTKGSVKSDSQRGTTLPVSFFSNKGKT